MSNQVIELFIQDGNWYAKSSDFIKDFDTDTIPTAYRSGAPADLVFSTISKLNPEATIVQHI